jgi:transposase InsO family protein
VENQTGMKIKTLQSDNGGEFVSKKFDDFLRECGIQGQTSAPYTPQQN